MKENSLFSSMHTHTTFCDGKDDIETMCRAAYEKKLFSIGFSAHAPVAHQLGKKTGWHLCEERLGEYIEQVNAAKKRWQGRLEVFLGLEVDYIKGFRSAIDNDIKAINADYIIGAVHYVVPVNGAEPFTIDAPLDEFEKGFAEGFNKDGEALMQCYYDTLAEMIAFGGFDILAHADIIKKNCQNRNFWTVESESCRQMEIARLIAGHYSKIAVEVNTGGLNRKKISETYPSVSFLKYFYEYNVPVIITSDAHCANDINGNYDNALKALVSAGFSEHFIFGGKNKWKTEKIAAKG